MEQASWMMADVMMPADGLLPIPMPASVQFGIREERRILWYSEGRSDEPGRITQ